MAGEQKHLPDWNTTPPQQRAALQRLSITLFERKRGMRRNRSKNNNRKPRNDSRLLPDQELVRLAAVLEAIAAMEALPLAPSARPRKGKRRCVT